MEELFNIKTVLESLDQKLKKLGEREAAALKQKKQFTRDDVQGIKVELANSTFIP